VDGSDFCLKHSNEADRIKGYIITNPDLKSRFDYHADSVETVGQELRLLRALVNDRLELAKTEADRINAFQYLHPAISTINKLVESLDKMKRQTDTVLEKEALYGLNREIAKILVEEISKLDTTGEIVERVATRIASVIAGAHN